MTNRVARIVFDTNALLSAVILPGSISERAWHIGVRYFQPVATGTTLEEFDRRSQKQSLQKYFDTSQDRQNAVLAVIRATEYVESESPINECRDPKDDQFLALAHDAQAIAIVTGDKDLLDMHPWRGIQIISPRNFVEAFEAGRLTISS